ncbi:glucan endo-1,3-beta-glucosidase 11-like [Olea europaea var. sylvestris]|uniref:glucan endo-1,3-beta-D-glucosidase n=2 Tax=Olea europaea subsp. europaea TaxID=158383 RepID=A0A8S0SH75_OLEEU|nr:glucan endo-1,3-beta-glucosidase 11-like [Olea europaea var. sylvestris]CAA2992442.1 glucan endo-1,3-beta-glucosidase 11-like [Olea europaea subsp. europaea]
MDLTSLCFSSSLPKMLLLILLLSVSLFPNWVSSLGINYGQIANNLPTPDAVVPLVKSIGASRVKLYDADPRVLKAFANTGVEFIVGLGNEYLAKMRDPKQAQDWVKINVQCHLPATKISCIAVGNEVLTFNDSVLSSNLLPAMENVHTALVNLNLDKQVVVTTAHNLGILENSYPPSSGSFRKDLTQRLTCILDFHSKTGSPFLINAYPYFAYKSNPKQVPIDFVLFESDSGITDALSGLHYGNMFHAQIDAVHSAMEKLGYKKVCLQISETGWPSKGDADEAGATLDNAKKYNANLLKLISEKKGTPMRPNLNLNIYVFALFNENMKPGPSSERNFGLFKPDGTPAYNLGFNATSLVGSNTTTSSGGVAGISPESGFSPPGSSSNGYLSISSDTERLLVQGTLSFWCKLVSPIIAFLLY